MLGEEGGGMLPASIFIIIIIHPFSILGLPFLQGKV